MSSTKNNTWIETTTTTTTWRREKWVKQITKRGTTAPPSYEEKKKQEIHETHYEMSKTDRQADGQTHSRRRVSSLAVFPLTRHPTNCSSSSSMSHPPWHHDVTLGLCDVLIFPGTLTSLPLASLMVCLMPLLLHGVYDDVTHGCLWGVVVFPGTDVHMLWRHRYSRALWCHTWLWRHSLRGLSYFMNRMLFPLHTL